VSNEKVLSLLEQEILIPICPEQLGGLPTPRESSEIHGDEVITKSGKIVTEYFKTGAFEVFKIAKLYNITEAILKQRSPSCGCGQIYDGSFSGKVIEGYGITAQLLKENGIKILSEEDLL
jgi:uncharacterized protein YbbK (DUF523 family)